MLGIKIPPISSEKFLNLFNHICYISSESKLEDFYVFPQGYVSDIVITDTVNVRAVELNCDSVNILKKEIMQDGEIVLFKEFTQKNILRTAYKKVRLVLLRKDLNEEARARVSFYKVVPLFCNTPHIRYYIPIYVKIEDSCIPEYIEKSYNLFETDIEKNTCCLLFDSEVCKCKNFIFYFEDVGYFKLSEEEFNINVGKDINSTLERCKNEHRRHVQNIIYSELKKIDQEFYPEILVLDQINDFQTNKNVLRRMVYLMKEDNLHIDNIKKDMRLFFSE